MELEGLAELFLRSASDAVAGGEGEALGGPLEC